MSVLAAPRTSDYMAVDSSIPVERFIGGGIVFNKNTLTFGSVSLAGIVAVNSPTPVACRHTDQRRRRSGQLKSVC